MELFHASLDVDIICDSLVCIHYRKCTNSFLEALHKGFADHGHHPNIDKRVLYTVL